MKVITDNDNQKAGLLLLYIIYYYYYIYHYYYRYRFLPYGNQRINIILHRKNNDQQLRQNIRIISKEGLKMIR